jgi:hypothetical protein
MTTLRALFASVALSLLLSGCVGTDFKRPEAGTLQLGKSTTADLLKAMGQPRQTGAVLKNSLLIKQLTYVYATKIGAAPIAPGVTPVRVMVFSTAGDVLVGQLFMSSFKDDATDFDATKVVGVVKGRTTKSQVLALFGPPDGEAIFPVVNRKEDTAFIYAYSQTSGSAFNLRFYRKVCTLSFGPNDVVSNVEFEESGSR